MQELWDHENKLYIGETTRSSKNLDIRRAYWVYQWQKRRVGVCYSAREFIYWWFFNPKRKKLRQPHVARKDHTKYYAWDNIEFQENSENVKERNERAGNPGKSQRSCVAIDLDTREVIKKFKSERDAANQFGCAVVTVGRHCRGATKHPFRYGPKYGKERRFTFQWK
jgi:hypothetical protein